MQICETPTPVRHDDCALEDWLAFLGHRWNALVLWQLSAGPRRFGDLQAALLGITPKVLTERLTALVARGLVLRSSSRGLTLYTLAPRGHEVGAILRDLHGWAERDRLREIP